VPFQDIYYLLLTHTEESLQQDIILLLKIHIVLLYTLDLKE
jgi:hypothetical protein